MQDIAFRVSFADPGDDGGQQRVRVVRADGPAARDGGEGALLGEAHTGDVFPLSGSDGEGLARAGLAADPFTGDGAALGAFLGPPELLHPAAGHRGVPLLVRTPAGRLAAPRRRRADSRVTAAAEG